MVTFCEQLLSRGQRTGTQAGRTQDIEDRYGSRERNAWLCPGELIGKGADWGAALGLHLIKAPASTGGFLGSGAGQGVKPSELRNPRDDGVGLKQRGRECEETAGDFPS